jgi:hypothetical protein
VAGGGGGGGAGLIRLWRFRYIHEKSRDACNVTLTRQFDSPHSLPKILFPRYGPALRKPTAEKELNYDAMNRIKILRSEFVNWCRIFNFNHNIAFRITAITFRKVHIT